MLHWQIHFWSGRRWMVRYPDLSWLLAANIGNGMVSLGYSVRLYNYHTGDCVKLK